MTKRGLQFRPGVRGLAGALLLTTASLGLCLAAVVTAVRAGTDRPAALLVSVVFALGSVFGVASLDELVRGKPMPKAVPAVVGLGLAAAFTTAAVSPTASSYGVGPLPRLLLAALATALVRQTWRLWDPA